MFQAIELSAQLAQERIEREIARSAERRRLAREPSQSIRRTIGYRDHRDRCACGGGALTRVGPVPVEGRTDSPARRPLP